MADLAGTGVLTSAVSGALAMGYAVAALFFAKFRRRTGARIFTWFAIAFVLLAVQRVVLIAVVRDPDGLPWSYVLRLLAFVLILAGIAAQNRSPRNTT
jgi:uncharacterized membrane protein HdeD (DUF308 family)